MKTRQLLSPRVLAACVPLLLALLAGCRHTAVGQQVLAEVNGRGILASEVEKFYQVQTLDQEQKPSAEQEQMQRIMILRELIDNEILLQRAEKMGLMATDAEVEAKFAERKSPYTEEEFQKQLKDRNLTTEDLKNDLRRQLSLEKVDNKEIRSKIKITDADIAKFYEQNKAGFNVPELRFHVAEIVVTPQPDVPVTNLKHDKARGEAEAKKKVDRIMTRLRNGEDFFRVAQELSEDPNTARNSGDLGYISASALNSDKVDPLMKRAIVGLEPGQVSAPIRGREAYYILKLIEKQSPGQRQLADPQVHQIIRTQLENRKLQLMREAYLETARNQSKIVNYYATQILEAAGAGKK